MRLRHTTAKGPFFLLFHPHLWPQACSLPADYHQHHIVPEAGTHSLFTCPGGDIRRHQNPDSGETGDGLGSEMGEVHVADWQEPVQGPFLSSLTLTVWGPSYHHLGG